jgi:hypothetical protein
LLAAASRFGCSMTTSSSAIPAPDLTIGAARAWRNWKTRGV